MCLHGALCSIPINLKCNMTTFRKKKSLTFSSHLGVEGVHHDYFQKEKNNVLTF